VATIECRNIVKRYGDVEVVHGFNLKVADNEFVVFLGPSGCGKSTILRMLAGLEDISAGELRIGGRVVNDLDPGERGIAMVFQNYALYPHMTVADNIAFGLRRLKVPEAEIRRRVGEVSATLGLDPYLTRRPAELSGGQQQRVAIARAMIKTPQVFLFDEPLSNLDAKLRNHMRVEIARLHQSLKTTTVYVTHDQHEAMTLADRIVLLKDGNIEQIGSPQQIFEQPRSRFVAGFIGTPAMNFLEMQVRPRPGGVELAGPQGAVHVPASRFSIGSRDRVTVGLRPVHLKPCLEGTPGCLRGKVDLVEYLGHDVMVTVDCAGAPVCAVLPVGQRPQIGEPLSFTVAAEHVHLFDAETGQSLFIADAANGTPVQLYAPHPNAA
jgi:multiple sugar transport system ATP-binding protein